MQVLGVPPPPRTVARHRATWADHFRLLAAVRVDAEVGPPRALGDDPACMRRGVRQVLGLVTLHVSETYVHIHPTAAWAGDGGARRARVAHGRPGDVRARGRRARAAVLLQAAGRGGGRGARCRWGLLSAPSPAAAGAVVVLSSWECFSWAPQKLLNLSDGEAPLAKRQSGLHDLPLRRAGPRAGQRRATRSDVAPPAQAEAWR